MLVLQCAWFLMRITHLQGQDVLLLEHKETPTYRFWIRLCMSTPWNPEAESVSPTGWKLREYVGKASWLKMKLFSLVSASSKPFLGDSSDPNIQSRQIKVSVLRSKGWYQLLEINPDTRPNAFTMPTYDRMGSRAVMHKCLSNCSFLSNGNRRLIFFSLMLSSSRSALFSHSCSNATSRINGDRPPAGGEPACHGYPTNGNISGKLWFNNILKATGCTYCVIVNVMLL